MTERSMRAPIFRVSDTHVAQRLERASEEFGDHPLLAELEWLAHQYQRLEARLDKITMMSDRLQSQVLDMNKVLQEQAISDPLTGLMNRNGLLDRLNAECARLVREHTAFGLLMLDLDHFKAINDAFGHHAGDQVLIAVAATLRQHMRPYDVFSRWGGEEFLLLVPAVEQAALADLAQRLLEAVRQVSVPGVPEVREVRVSVGLYYCDQPESPADSVRKADIALYRAKGAGRDQVVTFV
jgi:diguanylate cyclase (GGDEF)-like protein